MEPYVMSVDPEVDNSTVSYLARPSFVSPDEPLFRLMYLVLVSVATAFGNLLVLVAILRFKSLRRATNAMLGSLALADLLVGTVTVPLYIVWTARPGVFDQSPFMCAFVLLSCLLVVTASQLNLLILSVEHYLAVCRPFQHRDLIIRCPWLHAVAVTLTWTISFLTTVFSSFAFNKETKACSYYGAFDKTFLFVASIFGIFFPFIIIIILNIKVLCEVREHDRRRSCACSRSGRHRLTSTSSYVSFKTDGSSEGDHELQMRLLNKALLTSTAAKQFSSLREYICWRFPCTGVEEKDGDTDSAMKLQGCPQNVKRHSKSACDGTRKLKVFPRLKVIYDNTEQSTSDDENEVFMAPLKPEPNTVNGRPVVRGEGTGAREEDLSDGSDSNNDTGIATSSSTSYSGSVGSLGVIFTYPAQANDEKCNRACENNKDSVGQDAKECVHLIEQETGRASSHLDEPTRDLLAFSSKSRTRKTPIVPMHRNSLTCLLDTGIKTAVPHSHSDSDCLSKHALNEEATRINTWLNKHMCSDSKDIAERESKPLSDCPPANKYRNDTPQIEYKKGRLGRQRYRRGVSQPVFRLRSRSSDSSHPSELDPHQKGKTSRSFSTSVYDQSISDSRLQRSDGKPLSSSLFSSLSVARVGRRSEYCHGCDVSAMTHHVSRRVAKMVALVCASFILAWLPFFVVMMINMFCEVCQLAYFLNAVIMVAFTKSVSNPVIYALCHIAFRRAYKRVLSSPCFTGGSRNNSLA